MAANLDGGPTGPPEKFKKPKTENKLYVTVAKAIFEMTKLCEFLVAVNSVLEGRLAIRTIKELTISTIQQRVCECGPVSG